MALPIFQRTVTNDSGDVINGAEITVVDELTGLEAALFSDRAGITPLENPFFTGADGLAQFYAAPGEYRITASGVAGTVTWRYVLLSGQPSLNDDRRGVIFESKNDLSAGIALDGNPVSFAVGQALQTKQFDGFGGRAFWSVVSSQAQIDLGDGLYAELSKKSTVFAEDFGVKPGGDSTQAFWACMNYVESIGGAVVQMPAGVLEISIANSNDPLACVTIPSNTILRGEGMFNTLLTRPAAERTTNGLLLVNRGWKTNGLFNASGNIVFEDFAIDDGDPAQSRPVGDLIGISHAENVLIRRVRGLNHDQHFVDLAGAKNVEITQCFCNNKASLGLNATAIIQVDKAGGLSGSFNDGTACENIKIHRNTLIQESDSVCVQLFHGGGTDVEYNSIYIEENYISVNGNNRDCIGGDNTFDFRCFGLHIRRNTFAAVNSSARLINLFLDQSNSRIDGVSIVGNNNIGMGRVFAFVGASSASTSIADISNVLISGNHGVMDATGAGDCVLVSVNGIKDSIVCNNPLTAKYDGTGATGANVINSCKGLLYTGNSVTHDYAGSVNGATVRLLSTLNALTDMDVTVTNNYLDGTDVNYCIDGDGLSNNSKVHASQNRFKGSDPVIAHIREGDIPISDGTNGWHQLNLGGIDGALEISASQYSTGLNLDLKKAGTKPSKAKIELQFATTLSDLASDAEEINFGVTAVGVSGFDCCGTQIVDINQAAGTFSIVTGNLGVSFVINNTLFEALARPNGFIKAWAGV